MTEVTEQPTSIHPQCWVSPNIRETPSHAGILEVIRHAKDAGHIHADSALAEIGHIMGVMYVFARQKGFNRHEIERAE